MSVGSACTWLVLDIGTFAGGLLKLRHLLQKCSLSDMWLSQLISAPQTGQGQELVDMGRLLSKQYAHEITPQLIRLREYCQPNSSTQFGMGMVRSSLFSLLLKSSRRFADRKEARLSTSVCGYRVGCLRGGWAVVHTSPSRPLADRQRWGQSANFQHPSRRTCQQVIHAASRSPDPASPSDAKAYSRVGELPTQLTGTIITTTF